ncbi:MAG TPA: bifunctional diguanylate cyclase/phosphodiesterase [Candidatus Saccharimonadia bacterium]|nr:bifunctional diguanylate cyclase/phosphodiesterase [Candidatus Saccharimonadia bacterium]
MRVTPLDPHSLSLWLYIGQALAALLLGTIFYAYHRHYRHPHVACWAWGFALVATHTASGALSIVLAEQLPSIAGSRLALSLVSQFAAYAGVALITLGAALLAGHASDQRRWIRILVAAAAIIALFATFAFVQEPAPALRRLYVRVGWRHLLLGTALVLTAIAMLRQRGWLRGLGMRTAILALWAWGTQQLVLFTLFVWQSLVDGSIAIGPYLGLVEPLLLVFAGFALAIWMLDEERVRAEDMMRQFERLARFDAVTGLASERLLCEWLGNAQAAAAQQRHAGALLLLGVDRIEVLSNSTGVGSGDSALVALAERLRRALPADTPSPARIEGQRFAIVLPVVASREAVEAVAQRVLRAFDEPLRVGAREVNLTPRIGIAQFPEDAETPVAIIRAADLAMRHARGVDRPLVFYDSELRDRAKSRLSLEMELRHALTQDQFVLWYQPIVRANDHALAGFEALVRWRHPDRGLQPPALFLPAIEELGLMGELDRWVLEQACRQAAAWNAHSSVPLWMSVNVTAYSFRDGAYEQRVLETVGAAQLDPALLHLELTEQPALADVEEATRTLLSLREAGIFASLDDFGTGFSSLAQLQKLPVERIKLDRSFIANPDNLERDAAIVRAMVSLAHSLELEVVAEGIETDEQGTFCARAGVDLLQGYWFSKPLPPERCERLIAGTDRLPVAA